MIAVIGCIKETVSVKMLPPREDDRQQEGFGGYGYPGAYGYPDTYGMNGPQEPLQQDFQEEPEEEDDEITVKGSGCGYNIAVNLAIIINVWAIVEFARSRIAVVRYSERRRGGICFAI